MMMTTKGFFFFKFASDKGLLEVLESGPWMIRKNPLFLNRWSPNTSVSKEVHTKVDS